MAGNTATGVEKVRQGSINSEYGNEYITTVEKGSVPLGTPLETM